MSSITEEDIKRWATSMEELINNPIGLQEFMKYLEKEYCLENIRFWLAVSDFKKISDSEIKQKSQEIYDEFLSPGALYEVNIDGKTKEKMHEEMKSPSKSMFDDAAEHVYTLLLKKDCYPRFIRSDHYKNLLAYGDQPLMKRNFFGSVGYCNEMESDELGRITGSCLCLHSFSSTILQQQNQSQMYGSVKSRIGYGSRPSSPRDFFLKLDASSLYRSQSNHSVRDNSTLTVERASSMLTPVLDDVCPWDSLGYHSDTKLLSTPEAREQRRGHRSSSSSSLLLQMRANQTFAYDSASSDESWACSLANHFRHTCCMGDTRSRNRRHRRKHPKATSSAVKERVEHHVDQSSTSLAVKKQSRQQVPSSSSTTSLQETVFKSSRIKRFFSMSSLYKKQLNAVSNPVINVSAAEEDQRRNVVETKACPSKTSTT